MTRGRRGWIAAGVGLLVVGVGSVAALAGLGAGGGGALPAPHYVEEAAAAGLVHAYDGEFFHFVGGGVAVFDCDGDGRQDLYLAGGEEPAALFRNRSPVGGALAFEPVPSPATDLEHVVGAYPIDIDADGNVDLAVLRVGENVLLRGTGRLRLRTRQRGVGIRRRRCLDRPPSPRPGRIPTRCRRWRSATT